MMSTEMVAVVVRSFKLLMSNLLDTPLQHMQPPCSARIRKAQWNFKRNTVLEPWYDTPCLPVPSLFQFSKHALR